MPTPPQWLPELSSRPWGYCLCSSTQGALSWALAMALLGSFPSLLPGRHAVPLQYLETFFCSFGVFQGCTWKHLSNSAIHCLLSTSQAPVLSFFWLSPERTTRVFQRNPLRGFGLSFMSFPVHEATSTHLGDSQPWLLHPHLPGTWLC